MTLLNTLNETAKSIDRVDADMFINIINEYMEYCKTHDLELAYGVAIDCYEMFLDSCTFVN